MDDELSIGVWVEYISPACVCAWAMDVPPAGFWMTELKGHCVVHGIRTIRLCSACIAEYEEHTPEWALRVNDYRPYLCSRHGVLDVR